MSATVAVDDALRPEGGAAVKEISARNRALIFIAWFLFASFAALFVGAGGLLVIIANAPSERAPLAIFLFGVVLVALWLASLYAGLAVLTGRSLVELVVGIKALRYIAAVAAVMIVVVIVAAFIGWF